MCSFLSMLLLTPFLPHSNENGTHLWKDERNPKISIKYKQKKKKKKESGQDVSMEATI